LAIIHAEPSNTGSCWLPYNPISHVGNRKLPSWKLDVVIKPRGVLLAYLLEHDFLRYRQRVETDANVIESSRKANVI